MDTLKIKAFLLAEKYKSFSKAAGEFSYTPSAFSHIADSLEEELGVKLFVRTRRGVTLTESGKALYGKLKAVADAENALFKAAAAMREARELNLRIGTFSSISLHILPEILRSFKEAYPAVQTTILVDDHMQNWLEQDVADIILADETIDPQKMCPLMEDEYVAVVPESMFTGRERIRIEELYAYPLIDPNEAILDNYLDYPAFKEVITLRSVENYSALYMVRENIGVTVLPLLCIKNCPPGVKTLKLEPKISRTIGIVYNENNHSWACNKFILHIKKHLKSHSL